MGNCFAAVNCFAGVSTPAQKKFEAHKNTQFHIDDSLRQSIVDEEARQLLKAKLASIGEARRFTEAKLRSIILLETIANVEHYKRVATASATACCGPTGNTALHLAALAGAEDVVKALIDEGMDVKAANKKGQTALHCAEESNSAGAIRILIEIGADDVKSLASTASTEWPDILLAQSNGQKDAENELDQHEGVGPTPAPQPDDEHLLGAASNITPTAPALPDDGSNVDDAQMAEATNRAQEPAAQDEAQKSAADDDAQLAKAMYGSLEVGENSDSPFNGPQFAMWLVQLDPRSHCSLRLCLGTSLFRRSLTVPAAPMQAMA